MSVKCKLEWREICKRSERYNNSYWYRMKKEKGGRYLFTVNLPQTERLIDGDHKVTINVTWRNKTVNGMDTILGFFSLHQLFNIMSEKP